MKEDFIECLLIEALSDKSTKEQLISKIRNILNSQEVIEALKSNILNTIKNMEFEDLLYETLEEEDLFKPICNIIKRKLIKSLE